MLTPYPEPHPSSSYGKSLQFTGVSPNNSTETSQSSSYSQNHNSLPSNSSRRLDGAQQPPDTLAGRYSRHRYSHERTSASSSLPFSDDLSAMPESQGSHAYWNSQNFDRFQPRGQTTYSSSFRTSESSSRESNSVSENNTRDFARQDTLSARIHLSQHYHYAPIRGGHPQSLSQIERSGPSVSWRYKSSYSPTPTEFSQYRLSPSFSVQSSSSPDSLSDPPDEKPPRRRRRTNLSDCGSAASISSDASSACNSPQLGAISSSSSSRPRSRDTSTRTGPSRKVRGKHAQSQQSNTLGESSSFSVFMVKPSPAMTEPSGATYMSTVDFDADAAADAFEHGPTDLPPRPYIGGPDATSPWKPRKNLGTIPGSAMDYLPVVEARMSRLEGSLNAYVEYRGQQAAKNAMLPGMQSFGSGDEMDCDSSSRTQ